MADTYSGLPFPDDILQKEIDLGIKAVQGNVPLFKRLIQRVPAADQDAILNFLTRNEIRVIKGFGLEPYVVPQVSITLATEVEEPYMGDEMDMATVDQSVTAKVDLPVAIDEPAPFELFYDTIVNGPFPSGGGLIVINDEAMVYDSATGSTLHITGRSVRGTTEEPHAIGDDIIMKRLERYLGVHSLSTYRVDVVGDNGDLVLWMQALVKAILLMKRHRLSDLGFDSIKVSSSDFAPRPALYPAHVYLRAMTVQGRVEFAFPEELAVTLNVELNPTITGVIMSGGDLGELL